jgi:hypothetical protein
LWGFNFRCVFLQHVPTVSCWGNTLAFQTVQEWSFFTVSSPDHGTGKFLLLFLAGKHKHLHRCLLAGLAEKHLRRWLRWIRLWGVGTCLSIVGTATALALVLLSPSKSMYPWYYCRWSS